MPGFEWLVAGQGPDRKLSFLDRARNHWLRARVITRRDGVSEGRKITIAWA